MYSKKKIEVELNSTPDSIDFSDENIDVHISETDFFELSGGQFVWFDPESKEHTLENIEDIVRDMKNILFHSQGAGSAEEIHARFQLQLRLLTRNILPKSGSTEAKEEIDLPALVGKFPLNFSRSQGYEPLKTYLIRVRPELYLDLESILQSISDSTSRLGGRPKEKADALSNIRTHTFADLFLLKKTLLARKLSTVESVEASRGIFQFVGESVGLLDKSPNKSERQTLQEASLEFLKSLDPSRRENPLGSSSSSSSTSTGGGSGSGGGLLGSERGAPDFSLIDLEGVPPGSPIARKRPHSSLGSPLSPLIEQRRGTAPYSYLARSGRVEDEGAVGIPIDQRDREEAEAFRLASQEARASEGGGAGVGSGDAGGSGGGGGGDEAVNPKETVEYLYLLQQFQTVNETLQEYEKLSSSQRSEISKLIQLHEASGGALQNSNEQVQSLRGQVESLQGQISGISTERSSEVAQLRARSSEVAQLRADLTERSSEVAQLRAELATFRLSSATNADEILKARSEAIAEAAAAREREAAATQAAESARKLRDEERQTFTTQLAQARDEAAAAREIEAAATQAAESARKLRDEERQTFTTQLAQARDEAAAAREREAAATYAERQTFTTQLAQARAEAAAAGEREAVATQAGLKEKAGREADNSAHRKRETEFARQIDEATDELKRLRDEIVSIRSQAAQEIIRIRSEADAEIARNNLRRTRSLGGVGPGGRASRRLRSESFGSESFDSSSVSSTVPGEGEEAQQEILRLTADLAKVKSQLEESLGQQQQLLTANETLRSSVRDLTQQDEALNEARTALEAANRRIASAETAAEGAAREALARTSAAEGAAREALARTSAAEGAAREALAAFSEVSGRAAAEAAENARKIYAAQESVREANLKLTEAEEKASLAISRADAAEARAAEEAAAERAAAGRAAAGRAAAQEAAIIEAAAQEAAIREAAAQEAAIREAAAEADAAEAARRAAAGRAAAGRAAAAEAVFIESARRAAAAEAAAAEAAAAEAAARDAEGLGAVRDPRLDNIFALTRRALYIPGTAPLTQAELRELRALLNSVFDLDQGETLRRYATERFGPRARNFFDFAPKEGEPFVNVQAQRSVVLQVHGLPQDNAAFHDNFDYTQANNY
jgi:hypothetical protein